MVISAAVNVGIVMLALQPIRELKRTTNRVRHGDWTARARWSPLADPGVESLRQLLNRTLDAVESQRRTAVLGAEAVLQVEERARGRISDEMFSETAQSLASLLLQLRVVERRNGETDPGIDGPITESLRKVLEDVRTLARQLRPPELDELGFRAALDAHLRRLTETRSTPEIRVHGHVPEERLTSQHLVTLYRVVEAAVENALVHADAKRVEILFRPEEDRIVALITDDGRGFDVTDIVASTDGLGLPAMYERARLAGGALAVDSEPGEGTTVTLALPWIREVTEELPADDASPALSISP